MQQGFIYCPKGEHWWEKNTFMTPHARLVKPDVIRIFGGGYETNKGLAELSI